MQAVGDPELEQIFPAGQVKHITAPASEYCGIKVVISVKAKQNITHKREVYDRISPSNFTLKSPFMVQLQIFRVSILMIFTGFEFENAISFVFRIRKYINIKLYSNFSSLIICSYLASTTDHWRRRSIGTLVVAWTDRAPGVPGSQSIVAASTL